jgi:uncharacterized protein (TIGR02246 family)
VIPRASILCLWAVAAFGQLRPTVPQPTNLDFSQGEIGELPHGWNMPQLVLDAGYRAERRQQGCGQYFSSCVAIVPPSVIGTVRAAEVQQTFPADPYIGKSIRFSALLRLQDGGAGAYVHIRMRIDYANRKIDMRDSVASPVTSADWQLREVFGHVDPGAVSISIWARYVPSGLAWVAAPLFGVVEEARVPALPTTSFGVATATFPVKDAVGKTIRYSGWIKTENVSNGYAGLWWRVDGEQQDQVLSFDNSSARLIAGKPASGNGTIRGATGSTDWSRYQIELPVPVGARNIDFGLLLTGTGTAWFDSLSVQLNDDLYSDPPFDFDFESPAPKNYFANDNMGSGRYKVGIDNTTAFTGRRSMKMQFVGESDRRESALRPPVIPVTALDPEEAAVRALITRFADLRNSHDGNAAAALYTDDGEWLGPPGTRSSMKGQPALAKLWGGVPGRVERTVEAVDFPTTNTAIVHVATQYAEPGRHNETFVVVKEHLNWKIWIHQAIN